jgi:hypothetical protein
MRDTDFDTKSKDAESALLTALAGFQDLAMAEFDRCCEAVGAYVDVLRDGGYPPERVVIQVKAVLRQGGRRLKPGDSETETLKALDLRMEAFVSCAIARYFNPPV